MSASKLGFPAGEIDADEMSLCSLCLFLSCVEMAVEMWAYILCALRASFEKKQGQHVLLTLFFKRCFVPNCCAINNMKTDSVCV